ncbi:MAG TPA: FemAB family XrtA/PEP-CTERM system-associated protein [Longimicrobium sp.]|nr:FemAB family XrtA/PEP-CTERM system-associated protein [Longimicrobium sp.]
MSAVVERFDGPAAEWDAFVATRDDATHCHRWAWRRVVERAYGHACPYLAARGEDGSIRGVLPLVVVRGAGMGRHLVSMPYLNYGGPLGDDEAAGALAEAAAELAARLRCGSVELRCRNAAGVAMPPHPGKVTCLLALPEGGAEARWRAFPAKLRSQVRRAEKEGVEIRFGADQVEPFFRVFARTMRDLGTPTHPLSFFRAVAGELGDDAWFASAWLRGRPVAGGCAIAGGGTVEMVWASALREASPAAPNMALYWAVIRRAAEAGMRAFDFGRCTPGGGTHRFKQQWGTADVPLPWLRSERRPGAAVRPGTPGFALAQRVWRRLPVPVATLIGPRIRRAIPL